jgi:hypothetical protein
MDKSSTQTSFKISDEATHCFYNPLENKWCEYRFSTQAGMFRYNVYSELGSLERGYIGLAALTEKDTFGWHFVGCL